MEIWKTLYETGTETETKPPSESTLKAHNDTDKSHVKETKLRFAFGI